MSIKKYTSGSWTPACRKYGTETDIITTFPATIIGDGTPITSYTIKGNMEQNGTPTPSSPIYPSECGDLVTSGEHAGQYKLPLTLSSTTTDIYLGEVQSTRRVKKMVLTGEENWRTAMELTARIFYIPNSQIPNNRILCTHYAVRDWGETKEQDNSVNVSYTYAPQSINVHMDMYTTVSDFKAYLTSQYTAGTPVTVWYVLANPTTGIVNEPLRKIGDYVDSVSGTGLATSGAVQEFDVGTALKPSEVDMTYHGWHEHDDTKYST